MLRRFILSRINAEERKLGESLEYVRHMLRVSLPAFLRFSRIFRLSSYRSVLPADAAAVARIVATRNEDCGPCVQIEVNLAKQAGVDAAILRAVVAEDADALPGPLADVYRFTAAVVRATGEEDALRDRIRENYGEEGLVELAVAIASCRVYPVTKRALGYATSCRLVKLEV